MKRRLSVLIALLTVVLVLAPANAQQPSPPDPGVPDPGTPDPGQPAPDPGAPDPGQPGPGDPDTGQVAAPSPENSTTPRSTYFEEDFEDLAGWAQLQLSDDRPDASLWHVEPLGENGSMAAVLSNEDGLPRGLHQGLASPRIDLTPVPGLPENRLASSASEAAVARAGTAGQELFRTGVATGEGQAAGNDDGEGLSGNPLVTTGPVSLPNGPATLTVLHRFSFDDTLNEEGEAVSGLAVEARSPGGEWVPVEALMMTRPAYGAGAPGPRSETGGVNDNLPGSVDVCSFERSAQALVDSAVQSALGPFLEESAEFREDQVLPFPVPCQQVATRVPGTQETLFTGGETTLQASRGANQTDEGVPVTPNARIQPLDQRGFTGTTDGDGDGEPDLVAHAFDLSPWAGEQVELRFRAGTSAVTEVPGGIWAIDHAEVRAPARTSDLRVNLTAPSLDHEAPNRTAFPIRAEVQNVGFAGQEGPFSVTFTILREGIVQTEETVTAPAEELGFLESTTAQLNFTPLPGTPYRVQAEIVRGHADQDPRNDADAELLPVGERRRADLEIRPEKAVVASDELFATTVVAASDSNVRLDENLTLTAFPYDPVTQLPIGKGSIEIGRERIQLPPDRTRHPQGVGGAIQSANFTRTLPEGTYLLVARLGESTASTPLGVGSPPPPLLSEDFSEIDPGPATFEFEARSGDWTVRPDSDVSPVPRRLDPGSVANGSAWLPLQHESTLLRPADEENVTGGFADVQPPEDCPIAAPVIGNDACPEVHAVGSPVVLQSPRGTQRVHAMATEVPLHNASTAELEYLSSLIPPQDPSGLTEARVYVATDRDLQSLVDQLTDPENCPREEVCTVVNENPSVAGIGVGVTPAGLVRSVNANAVDVAFALEENVRCEVPEALESSQDVPEGTAATIKDFTCPSRSGDEQTQIDRCQVAACEIRVVDEPTQLAALGPLLSGTLVERDTDPHTWERTTVDLDAWAGQNVTVAFVFLTQSDEATETYNANPRGNAPVTGTSIRGNTGAVNTAFGGTVGLEPPGQPRGAFMVSRPQVVSDDGLKLAPENDQRFSNEVVNTAQTLRPGQAETGWNTIGYDHVEGLGDEETPLRTSAQLLTGQGRPTAEGADAGPGLQLGTREGSDTGVLLYPRRVSTNARDDSASPAEVGVNANDPAVTVVASPALELEGAENPQLRFRQRFDLSTLDKGSQWLTQSPDRSTVAAALKVPPNVTDADGTCSLGERDEEPNEYHVTFQGLSCVLDTKRNADGEFDVQNQVLREQVAKPRVSAGLFVQARVLEDGEFSEPRVVEPVDGYRFPIDDPGGFQPTLNYTVESADSAPGFTTPFEDRTRPHGHIYTETRRPSFVGTPAWAGHSDTDDPDREPDWTTSKLDLSPFAGETVKLEFVLVARHDTKERDHEGGGGLAEATKLTERPWSIDDVEVVEGDTEGQVSIEQMRWPNDQLPVVSPEEDLPVRLTVGSPTGLEKPIHANATLVDGEGCVVGSTSLQAQFKDEAGRVKPMPADARLELPEMVIERQRQGSGPFTLKAGVDVGSPPSVVAASDVVTSPIEDTTTTELGALNVTSGPEFELTAQDPHCEPTVDVVTVAPRGLEPDVEKDREDDAVLDFEVVPPDAEQSRDEHARLEGPAGRLFLDGDDEQSPLLLAVSEGEGGRAGGTSLVMFANATVRDRTARVDPPADRVPAQSPVEIELESPQNLEPAVLWSLDPTDARPDPTRIWTGQLDAGIESEVTVTLSEIGPRVLVLTGGEDGEDSVLGGTLIVARDAQRAGDPTQIDNAAELTAIAGRRSDLTVQDVEATPRSDLSTTPRRIDARVQNTGTTSLHDVTVRFLTEGTPITTKTRDVMSPGEVQTFTLPEFTTGSEPSKVVEVRASSSEGVSSTGATSVRSLVKLRSLSPAATGDSDGWTVSGDQATFQDPETGEAPQETVGSIDLGGARMEGLAGVAVQLDHRLDMEDRFDGGQVLLSGDSTTQPLEVGAGTKEMGPYSPIAGKALTGTRDTPEDSVRLSSEDADTEVLLNQDADELLGFPLLADDPDDEPDELGFADCEGRTFPDQEIDVETEGPYCVHSEPTLPTPSTAMTRGVYYFPPTTFLSSEDSWTVNNARRSERYELEVPRTSNYLFLEGGPDLVKAAQEQGKLEIRFDEARLLDPTRAGLDRPLSIEVCARFMHAEDTRDGVKTGELPSVRRCTGLTHEDVQEQDADKPWSRTILTVGNIPEAGVGDEESYNLVRIELSLRENRVGAGSTGLMGPSQGTDDNPSVGKPVKGWFVGPVTASAGDTERTWRPDARELESTDPNTGLSPSSVLSQAGNELTLSVRDKKQIDQYGLVAFDQARITLHQNGQTTEHELSTLSGVDDGPLPLAVAPLTPCQWHSAGNCDWQDLAKGYGRLDDYQRDEKKRMMLALSTAPRAMNLTCSAPPAELPYEIEEDSTSGCDSPVALPGMGVQVLDSGSLDRGGDSPCEDDPVGHPALWRTRCLHARRVEPDEEEGEVGALSEGGDTLRFETTDRLGINNGDPRPLRARGHSVDFRLVVPADLRFAASGVQAWAEPNLEELGDATGTNFDLPVRAQAQARLQGQDEWQPVEFCETRDGVTCFERWRSLDSLGVVNLTDFVGQRVELALRIQLPHPTLSDDHGQAAREPSLALNNVSVEAGYLRLIDRDLGLRAWTDPSIQGEGWEVRGVELFGLPIKSNLGFHELESKALRDDVLHVHTRTVADGDLYMSAPMNLTVYNQGSRALTTPLEAALDGRHASEQQADPVFSTSEAWEETFWENGDDDAGTCRVEIKPGEVELPPGSVKRVNARVWFIPEDADDRPRPEDTLEQDVVEQCFPGSMVPTADDEDPRAEQRHQLRLHVNVSDVPEEDYVASDDGEIQPVRPNPFAAEGTIVPEPHRPRLDVSNATVDPTRPGPDEPVRVSANVTLVDHAERGANLELQLVAPGDGSVLRTLDSTQADKPVTTFQPYRTTRLNWTLDEVPEGELLVRVVGEIRRSGDRIESRDRAWLAKGSVADDVRGYNEVLFGADSLEADGARCLVDLESQEQFCTTPGGEDDNPQQVTGPQDNQESSDTLQMVIGTPWVQVEDSPPPLVGVRGRWNIEGRDESPEAGTQTATGWAVQVCHVPGDPDPGECPIDQATNNDGSGTAQTGEWAWRTVNVLRVEEDSRAHLADLGPFGASGDCGGTLDSGANRCTSARDGWANMHTGEDAVEGTSPGFGRPFTDDAAWRTVIASMTQCPEENEDPHFDPIDGRFRDHPDQSDEGDKCPLAWNETSQRQHSVRVRVAAFSANTADATTVTVSNISLAPVAAEIQPRQDTAGFPIPEEAPKAVPMDANSIGEVGAKIEPHIREPPGWDVRFEGVPRTNAIEAETTPRVLVEAPISASGVSQSAALKPTFDVPVDPIRSVGPLVPVGVQAGQHPDLVVTDVKVGEDLQRDEETLVQARIKNTGFATSDETQITGVARYDDGRVDLLEPPKDRNEVTVPSLPPGVEETVVLKWRPSESGNASVRVAADLTRPEPLAGPVVDSWDGGQVAELRECADDECNNVGVERTAVEPPRVADTSVDVDVLGDRPLVVGESVDVRVTVANDGPATVPAFEVRLLAGVVSLLEEDPLRVTEPLAPGETWTRTVELIPGFGGDLNLVGRVTSDESLVRERRGLQAGGGTFGEDNTESRQLPVVARGLALDVPRVVDGEPATTNGTVRVPATFTNLGSEPLNVSAAAKTDQGIGTLVDEAGDPVGTVTLASGESRNATLELLYDGLPDAGRRPVTIDAVSEAGVQRSTLELEVPAKVDVHLQPVVETARAGKVRLPVTVTSSGNAPVQAQVSVDAPALSQATETVRLEPGNTSTVLLDTWLDGSTPPVVEGRIEVRTGETTRRAPLRLVQEGDVVPTIERVQVEGGASPHTWVRVANLGSTSSTFNLTLVQDDETLTSEEVRVQGLATRNVTLDALPKPGEARVRLQAPATGADFNWTVRVPDLMPDVQVLETRMDPGSPDAGETVTVRATIANDGGSPVDLRPGLFVDGVLHTVAAEEQTVDPGTLTQVSFTWTAEEGAHTVTVDADPQDSVEDARPSDNAQARDLEIQAGGGVGGVQGVPFLPGGPAAALGLLAALAWIRRDPRE